MNGTVTKTSLPCSWHKAIILLCRYNVFDETVLPQTHVSKVPEHEILLIQNKY